MSNAQQDNAAGRDTSQAVQLFQDAHQKMVMLKRVEEQMAQLVQRRQSLMEELRHVQAMINEEFDRMFTNGRELPSRLKNLGATVGAASTAREAAFADESVLEDDDAAVA